MCYIYNQWYDISCATLYILPQLKKKQNKTNTKQLAFSSSFPFKDQTDCARCYYVSITYLLPLFEVAGGDS